MSLPIKPLDAIRAAGAAAFKADAALQVTVKDYAAQVHARMLQDPFDVSNDTLFEDWKTVARLSHAMGQIEAELQKIYAAASSLGSGGAPKVPRSRAIAAPTEAVSKPVELIQEINATDVVPKQFRQKAKADTRKSKSLRPLSGNTAKVLGHLVKILDPNMFTKINQSAEALAVGLPKGSMGASMAKLLKEGYLAEGPQGGFMVRSGKD